MATQASLTLVQKLYIAYYGRPADPGGLTYWANQIDGAGGNPTAVINAFGSSSEATAIYGNQGPNSQINNVYTNILGRSADAAGQAYYANQITNGQLTLAGLANAVLQGAAYGSDALVVANKYQVANSFTSGLVTAAQQASYNAVSNQSIVSSIATALAGVTANSTSVNSAISSMNAIISLYSYSSGRGYASFGGGDSHLDHVLAFPATDLGAFDGSSDLGASGHGQVTIIGADPTNHDVLST